MLSLYELYAEEKLESIENSLGIERQKSLEAKISPCLDKGQTTRRLWHRSPYTLLTGLYSLSVTFCTITHLTPGIRANTAALDFGTEVIGDNFPIVAELQAILKRVVDLSACKRPPSAQIISQRDTEVNLGKDGVGDFGCLGQYEY